MRVVCNSGTQNTAKMHSESIVRHRRTNNSKAKIGNDVRRTWCAGPMNSNAAASELHCKYST